MSNYRTTPLSVLMLFGIVQTKRIIDCRTLVHEFNRTSRISALFVNKIDMSQLISDVSQA